MAKIIPGVGSSATSGERRFGQRLEALLEDDYLCWFNVTIGRSYKHPDFIILHPRRGLLVVEVKDWKLNAIQSITPETVDLMTSGGLKRKASPLRQARQDAMAIAQRLERDPALLAPAGHCHRGKLL